jgi:hypothetical protein
MDPFHEVQGNEEELVAETDGEQQFLKGIRSVVHKI